MNEFNDIYTQYFRDVYRYVISLCKNELVAEDITQETFFKAIKGIDDFDGRCKMRVWLCQIAKNTYYSYCEREKKSAAYPEGWDSDEAERFEEKLANKEQALEIHKALHLLDEPYKEVFSLRVFGELPFNQIADIFEKTESWARVTYHRARIKLREELS